MSQSDGPIASGQPFKKREPELYEEGMKLVRQFSDIASDAKYTSHTPGSAQHRELEGDIKMDYGRLEGWLTEVIESGKLTSREADTFSNMRRTLGQYYPKLIQAAAGDNEPDEDLHWWISEMYWNLDRNDAPKDMPTNFQIEDDWLFDASKAGEKDFWAGMDRAGARDYAYWEARVAFEDASRAYFLLVEMKKLKPEKLARARKRMEEAGKRFNELGAYLGQPGFKKEAE